MAPAVRRYRAGSTVATYPDRPEKRSATRRTTAGDERSPRPVVATTAAGGAPGAASLGRRLPARVGGGIGRSRRAARAAAAPDTGPLERRRPPACLVARGTWHPA